MREIIGKVKPLGVLDRGQRPDRDPRRRRSVEVRRALRTKVGRGGADDRT